MSIKIKKMKTRALFSWSVFCCWNRYIRLDLHPVELPDGVSAVRTAVDDVLTSVHTEWDQTTAQPQPKQAQDKGNHPGKSASFKTGGGHHFRLACRTFGADRMFSELLSCDHDSWLGDNGHA